MFKYNLNDTISIKNPIEVSGKIFKRHIIFNKNGVLQITYDIKCNRDMILNIFEKDIIGQEEINELEMMYQFKYNINDTIYTTDYLKGIIIEQRYSESDTKIDYKYRVAIDGNYFIIEEKYLINESEKDLLKTLTKKDSEPIIEPKIIKTDLIISSKKKQELIENINNKLNILIEKIDHLDDRIDDLENNISDLDDRINDFENDIGDIKNDIIQNNNLLETIDQNIIQNNNLLETIDQNIDENNNLLETIDQTLDQFKTELVSQSDIENQFKELKKHIDTQIDHLI
jgi:predicted  nucleic acid-binding Zn-ribbon protein